MIRYLNRLFNIKTAEWPRLMALYAMAFIFIAGITWGEWSVQAAFLFKIGPQSLPRVIALNALVSILAVAIYTPFVDRVSHGRLLIGVSLVCAAAIGVGRLLLGLDLPNAAYPLLYVLAIVVRQTFNLQWWTYVNGFYDTRAAKRIIPILSTASKFAVIAAGETMPLLNARLTAGGVVSVWIGSLLLVALIAAAMPLLIRPSREEAGAAPLRPPHPTRRREPRPPFLQSTANALRESRRALSQMLRTDAANYLRWLALLTFLAMVLFALMEYSTGIAFIQSGAFGSPQELSVFLGRWSSRVSLILLPFQLFLLSRLVERIGLGNAALIFPALSLAVCGALAAGPPVGGATAAHLDRSILRTVLYNPIDNLLYNALPTRVKGRARALIGGLIAPLGSLTGGGALMLTQSLSAGWLPAPLLIVTAAAFVVAAAVVRQRYARALLTLLEQEDFSALFSAPSALPVSDPTALPRLMQRLQESESGEFRVFLAKLIAEVGGKAAIPTLAQAIREEKDGRIRSMLLDVLTTSEMRDEAVGKLYVELLADPDVRVRRSAVAGLEAWAGGRNERFLARAIDLLDDPDAHVRAQVIPSLARSGDFFYTAAAFQAQARLLADENAERRALGVRLFGQLGDARFIRRLATHLQDPADPVRLEAILAIESLAVRRLPADVAELFLAQLGLLLTDPVERVRQAAVAILRHIRTPQADRLLVRFLTDPAAPVRAAAVDALSGLGRQAIPALLPSLGVADGRAGLTEQAMAAVILGRVAPDPSIGKQARELIAAQIYHNLRAIYQNLAHVDSLTPYSDYNGVSLLQSALREQNERRIADIFELLTAAHGRSAVGVMVESLSSADVRTRANAVEALESLATRPMARLIAPLLDPQSAPAHLLSIAAAEWASPEADVRRTVAELVGADNVWLRAITVFALGEIGARQQAAAIETPPTPLPLEEIKSLAAQSLGDPADEVRAAARAAQQMLGAVTARREGNVLSTIERMIFLKGVPFFRGMTVDQLKVLATVCEERFFAEDTVIFNEGEPGGAMYVVVSGRVAIEREGQRKGSVVRLATIEAHSYFGEMSLFDSGPRSGAARALRDTETLELRRAPLIALIRQQPDLGLELIHVLSQRLREANDRIAQLTRSSPRELQNLYDQLI